MTVLVHLRAAAEAAVAEQQALRVLTQRTADRQRAEQPLNKRHLNVEPRTVLLDDGTAVTVHVDGEDGSIRYLISKVDQC